MTHRDRDRGTRDRWSGAKLRVRGTAVVSVADGTKNATELIIVVGRTTSTAGAHFHKAPVGGHIHFFLLTAHSRHGRRRRHLSMYIAVFSRRRRPAPNRAPPTIENSKFRCRRRRRLHSATAHDDSAATAARALHYGSPFSSRPPSVCTIGHRTGLVASIDVGVPFR